ncbi:MAG: OadG family transporter subunit [Anaerolineae bacterium]|nr:OadG family transporter subunit [Anaerolineae bacterium]
MDAELLRQALVLTAIGMGMTFAAIGALVLGMYALGGIKPRKSNEAEAVAEEAAPAGAEAATLPDTADARYLAAVAAVAVARAQSVREARQPANVAPDQWRSHVRSRHLAQRDY